MVATPTTILLWCALSVWIFFAPWLFQFLNLSVEPLAWLTLALHFETHLPVGDRSAALGCFGNFVGAMLRFLLTADSCCFNAETAASALCRMPTTFLPPSSPSTSSTTLSTDTSAELPPAPSMTCRASAKPPTSTVAPSAPTPTVQGMTQPPEQKPSRTPAQMHTLTPRTTPPPHGAATPAPTTTLSSVHRPQTGFRWTSQPQTCSLLKLQLVNSKQARVLDSHLSF